MHKLHLVPKATTDELGLSPKQVPRIARLAKPPLFRGQDELPRDISGGFYIGQPAIHQDSQDYEETLALG